MHGLSTGLILGGFAIGLIYFIFLFYYNMRLPRNERNHFRNSFPYQFYLSDPVPIRVILYVLLILGSLMTSIGEIFYFSLFQSTYISITGTALAVSLLLLAISNLLPLSYYRLHLFFSALSFALFDASTMCLATAKWIQAVPFPEEYSLPVFITIGIIGLIGFLSLFNPKLLDWFKMDRAEENGKVIYVKPKVNWYAFYEWLYLIAMVIVGFLLLLNQIVCGI